MPSGTRAGSVTASHMVHHGSPGMAMRVEHIAQGMRAWMFVIVCIVEGPFSLVVAHWVL